MQELEVAIGQVTSNEADFKKIDGLTAANYIGLAHSIAKKASIPVVRTGRTDGQDTFRTGNLFACAMLAYHTQAGSKTVTVKIIG